MTTAILDRGLVVDDGRLQYAWFKVRTDAASVRYHAVALRELAAIPLNLRDDPDVLGKQWAAVRGLYNARVNFAYAAAGIFAPEHIGIVQYYGATADASNHSDAARDALHQVAAVEAALANYPQSRLVAPTLRWVEWYRELRGRSQQPLPGNSGLSRPTSGTTRTGPRRHPARSER